MKALTSCRRAHSTFISLSETEAEASLRTKSALNLIRARKTTPLPLASRLSSLLYPSQATSPAPASIPQASPALSSSSSSISQQRPWSSSPAKPLSISTSNPFSSSSSSSTPTPTQASNTLKPFHNTTTVITGGSRGIGLAIAHAFRKQGGRVVLIGRNIESLEGARSSLMLGSENVDVLAGWSNGLDKSGVALMEGDVAIVGDVERMCKTISQTYGPTEHLINCAGISRDSILLSMDPLEASEVIATNLFGTILMSRGISKGMLRRRKGCIINVSSVLGLKGVEGASVYSASKAGVVGFTKSLAKELGPRGIRVSAIAPGFIETDMTANLTEQQRTQYLAQTPLGRFGSAEEVASAATFLAQAQYITGQTLVIDGGYTA
ncbi:NAD(P)-binding protein [Rhizoclosmatium globosum]|uniref:NAD(P)-binding protein n=1 Tax=Rhizoclosmatium globosum TaxID=329046 RepID=A0A1Y2CRD7_9FUNG|nr:NAD(P)-binding protein [Rhizoclosmatium globosum]|eukprot:ORY49516.1 NAD(P)-binding protein [Rhizoclosmatium globosum]